MKYAAPESATKAIAKYNTNEKGLRILITGPPSSECVQHAPVSPRYYSDIVAIGQHVFRRRSLQFVAELISIGLVPLHIF